MVVYYNYITLRNIILFICRICYTHEDESNVIWTFIALKISVIDTL